MAIASKQIIGLIAGAGAVVAHGHVSNLGGNYVLRHEIIALHSAGNVNGAKSYPQCFNLAVTGSGSVQPSGVPGTALYRSTDAGILYDLYGTTQSYVVPGPTQYTGFPNSVVQTSSVATATSTVIPGYICRDP
ncbi:putative endoglucanase iv precursor [Diaporthe ampelina]|uniref:lytic cellulose monooxygenase (C4-dehydrogenating) n=1 Tax=Diaporthe ampelina TaxID=1214573 RepID=A0A0G2HKG8_9PEZI|nr:putative endoglucanase iv precursor [Diaporthe ampelina]